MKKAGFLISFLFFSMCGDTQYIKTLFEQEKVNGRVNTITEIQLTPKSDGTETDSLIIKRKYDNKGNTIQEIFTSIDHVPPDVAVFDKDANLIKKRRLMNVSVFNYTTHYKDNKQKNTICNAFATKEAYLFDKKGTLTRSNKYQTDGQLLNKALYKYDDKNRLVALESYTNADSLYEQWVYKYDLKNLVIEKDIYYGKHQIQERTIYTYLDFDKLGNWIKRKQEEIERENRTAKIVTRVIEYSK
jgi:hypothetical protein